MAVLPLKCYLNDKVVWLRGLRGVILYTFTRLHTEFGTLAFRLHRPRVAATLALARARARHMHASLCASVGLYIRLHIPISASCTRVHAHCRTSTRKASSPLFHVDSWIWKRDRNRGQSRAALEKSRLRSTRSPAYATGLCSRAINRVIIYEKERGRH